MTCEKCNGDGYYAYDEHHLKACEGCCKHLIPNLYQQFEGQPNPRVWTCRRCGTEFPDHEPFPEKETER